MAAPPAAAAAAAASPATVQAPLPSAETQLEYLVTNTKACVLRPYSFFVSWQGVLTLAYRGFPPALIALKEQLSDFYPSLPKESPGSKWPKTSLACLREGQRLTPQQLQRLNDLCTLHSGAFQTPGAVKAQAVLVNTLSSLIYETRCCERIISRRMLPLAGPIDMADASAEEIARVQGVVAEADDADYWYHASRDGNREKHYRVPAVGATLAHELACFRPRQPLAAAEAAAAAAEPGHADAGKAASGGSSNGSGGGSSASGGAAGSEWSSALPGIIAKFRAAVEEELPELYAWFDEASLHVTIRAIIL